MNLEIHGVKIDYPVRANIIIGQTHFIKTAEDLYEVIVSSANPLQVVVASTSQGWGFIGVIDGSPPQGLETDADKVGAS